MAAVSRIVRVRVLVCIRSQLFAWVSGLRPSNSESESNTLDKNTPTVEEHVAGPVPLLPPRPDSLNCDHTYSFMWA